MDGTLNFFVVAFWKMKFEGSKFCWLLWQRKPDLLPSLQVRWRCSVHPHFSSAGKGPFLTGKAKNICYRCTFLGRKWGEGHGPSLTGKFFRSLEVLWNINMFRFFKTYFRGIRCYKLSAIWFEVKNSQQILKTYFLNSHWA